MNTTLPPNRDLPPGRHAEIRTTVLTEVTGKPARRWAMPMVTAAAALAVIGLVAWVAPWDSGRTAASPPSETTSTNEPPNAIAEATEVPPNNVALGMPADEVRAIEEGCAQTFQPGMTLSLRQVLIDDAGRLALLHGTDGTYEYLVDCVLDGPAMPYNPSGGGVGPFTPPVTADSLGANAGGDLPGGKPEYAGQHGSQVVMGRMAPAVARVTVTIDGDTVDAVLGGDAYLARIVRPTDWANPENQPVVVVRAYDKNGTLLGEVGP